MNATQLAVPSASRRFRRHGFTLTELMMAMFVFTIFATGAVSGVLQIRRLAQMNILKNTAFTIAQGYLEQMKSMNSVDLTAAADPTVSNKPPLPTKSVSALASGQIQRDDPLYVDSVPSPVANVTLLARADQSPDVWNVKQIMVDLTGNTALVMQMRIDVDVWRDWTTVTNGSSTQSVPAPTFLIQMDFQYMSDGYKTVGWQSGSLRMVRTDIQ